MKIDLHCHSKHSKRPMLWIMQKLGCPESFTDPVELYHLVRQKGMTHVTITDHNSIDGCLEIGGLPNTITGCEYTTYFPEDRCKIHVLTYGLTEGQHYQLNTARDNIFDFVDYVQREGIPHVCAHPLFGVNDRLTPEHIEKLVLLFKNWEWNGDISPHMNRAMMTMLNGLTMADIERLVNKHGILPRFPEPWKKNIVAGSDDHSSLSLASSYTHVAGANTFDQFWQGVENGQARTRSSEATPEGFARKVYGTAYQFYKSRFDLGQYVNKDIFLRFLDRSLQTRPETPEPWLTRLHLLLSRHRRPKELSEGDNSLFDLARYEAERLIREDPQLMQTVHDGNAGGNGFDRKWFEFVNQVSNRVLVQFGQRFLDRVLDAHFFDLFHSLGSAGALYALLAPYFVGFSLFTKQREWSQRVLAHFGNGEEDETAQSRPVRVAHFTDTFHEVNGVARTLHQQLATAQKLGKEYSIVTCFPGESTYQRGVCQFVPVGVYDLPEYNELKLLFPPFLQMLQHCYEEEITHIHVSTPGPVGLAALGIARILQLPISGTYHTAFPQYAKALTEDSYIEEMSWRCMIWFYDQLDSVYVPSRATGEELVEKGINPEKVRVYPRGCDIERFHPDKRQPILRERFGVDDGLVNMVYVGRVSKEKNLHLLSQAYKQLLEQGVDARLIVVGDGPYRNEMANDLEASPALFTGYLNGDDLPALYADCDFLVFPSTTDTFGNVVLEAQACGIPAIVSDQGGPCENVVPGETGLVVASNDRDALVEAMVKLARDRDLRLEMGGKAHEYMSGRGFQQAFERLYAMYAGGEPSPHASGPSALAGSFLDAFHRTQAIAS